MSRRRSVVFACRKKAAKFERARHDSFSLAHIKKVLKMSALQIFHQDLDWTVEVHKIPNDEELETFIHFVRDEIYSKGSGFRLFFDVSKVATTTLEDGMRCLHVAHQLGAFFRGLAPEVRCRASRGVGVITASVCAQRVTFRLKIST